MKLREERNRLCIETSTFVEEAYVEEVLGLRKDGDYVKLVRRNAMGLSSLACLETVVDPHKDAPQAWKPNTFEEHIANSSCVEQLLAGKLGEFVRWVYKTLSADSAMDFTQIDEALNGAAQLIEKAVTACGEEPNEWYVPQRMCCSEFLELVTGKALADHEFFLPKCAFVYFDAPGWEFKQLHELGADVIVKTPTGGCQAFWLSTKKTLSSLMLLRAQLSGSRVVEDLNMTLQYHAVPVWRKVC